MAFDFGDSSLSLDVVLDDVGASSSRDQWRSALEQHATSTGGANQKANARTSDFTQCDDGLAKYLIEEF
eukprot:5505441-Pyramimonas_sp.AAC.1